YRRCDTYRGPAAGGGPIPKLPGTGEQLIIDPQSGTAPLRLRNRDLTSFFKGGIPRVRIWSRTLQAGESQTLFTTDAVPRDGLGAEYRLEEPSGTVARDSRQWQRWKHFRCALGETDLINIQNPDLVPIAARSRRHPQHRPLPSRLH